MTDQQILTAMDLHYNEGMSLKDVGARFGKSKGSMAGLFMRIRNQVNKTDQDGNQNGTMPRKWWAK
tara:strand:+ start:16969 stop:17166 length:198 start_codon:yes stop_codon:yes gene_type:complete